MSMTLISSQMYIAVFRPVGIMVVALITAVATLVPVAALADAASEPPSSPERKMRILVLPFYDLSAIFGDKKSLRGPLTGKVFITATVAPKAADALSAQLRKRLSLRNTLSIIEPKMEDLNAMVGISPLAGPQEKRIALIQQVGRQRGAEAVFCGYIYTFRERVGTAFGVEQPAAVAFELNLVNVSTGAVIWQADFDETQQALNDNLLKIGEFFRRKGRWISAQEMAFQAIDDLMKKFDPRN